MCEDIQKLITLRQEYDDINDMIAERTAYFLLMMKHFQKFDMQLFRNSLQQIEEKRKNVAEELEKLLEKYNFGLN